MGDRVHRLNHRLVRPLLRCVADLGGDHREGDRAAIACVVDSTQAELHVVLRRYRA